ncbi:MAG TPA: AarF/UbiB family protein, partial [Anaerolineales bacterium]
RRQRYRQIAADFRALAAQMGGVMIKVGQFLSARLDVLPREVTDELAGLQDEVRPESFEDIRRVVEAEFGAPLESKFAEFQELPMASASIGQVHYARLRVEDGHPTGPMVVVKVQRPNIGRIVATDLSALRVVGGWLNAYPPIRRRANVDALMAEFSRTLYEEIDYLHEGKNAEIFGKNFQDRPEVCVPKVYWETTTLRVLTLENVLAIKITDYPRIEQAGVDRAEVANRLFDTYLMQIFDDHYFHADPHPGNLFILPAGEQKPGEKREWKLVFVDFGMAGSIPPTLLDALREMFVGVGTRDAGRVVRAYQMMGVLLPGADLDLLERAGARALERFWGKSTKDMMRLGHDEAMEFLSDFGDLVYEMPFQIPENLILLGRTLAILSGICSGLDPQFNIWTTVAPYTEKLLISETGRSIQTLFKELTDALSAMVALPRKAVTVLDRIESGRLEVRSPQISDDMHRIERAQHKTVRAVLFAAFLLSAIQLFLAQQNGIAWVALVLAIITFLLVLR